MNRDILLRTIADTAGGERVERVFSHINDRTERYNRHAEKMLEHTDKLGRSLDGMNSGGEKFLRWLDNLDPRISRTINQFRTWVDVLKGSRLALAGLATAGAMYIGNKGREAYATGMGFQSSLDTSTAQLSSEIRRQRESERAAMRRAQDLSKWAVKYKTKTPYALDEIMHGLSNFAILYRGDTRKAQEAVQVASRLATKNPGQGLQGAQIAIQEAESGYLLSAQRRFNLPKNLLMQNYKASGSNGLEAIKRTLQQMNVTDDLMFKVNETGPGLERQIHNFQKLMYGELMGGIYKARRDHLKFVRDRLRMLADERSTLHKSVQLASQLMGKLSGLYFRAIEFPIRNGEKVLRWLNMASRAFDPFIANIKAFGKGVYDGFVAPIKAMLGGLNLLGKGLAPIMKLGALFGGRVGQMLGLPFYAGVPLSRAAGGIFGTYLAGRVGIQGMSAFNRWRRSGRSGGGESGGWGGSGGAVGFGPAYNTSASPMNGYVREFGMAVSVFRQAVLSMYGGQMSPAMRNAVENPRGVLQERLGSMLGKGQHIFNNAQARWYSMVRNPMFPLLVSVLGMSGASVIRAPGGGVMGQHFENSLVGDVLTKLLGTKRARGVRLGWEGAGNVANEFQQRGFDFKLSGLYSLSQIALGLGRSGRFGATGSNLLNLAGGYLLDKSRPMPAKLQSIVVDGFGNNAIGQLLHLLASRGGSTRNPVADVATEIAQGSGLGEAVQNVVRKHLDLNFENPREWMQRIAAWRRTLTQGASRRATADGPNFSGLGSLIGDIPGESWPSFNMGGAWKGAKDWASRGASWAMALPPWAKALALGGTAIAGLAAMRHRSNPYGGAYTGFDGGSNPMMMSMRRTAMTGAGILGATTLAGGALGAYGLNTASKAMLGQGLIPIARTLVPMLAPLALPALMAGSTLVTMVSLFRRLWQRVGGVSGVVGGARTMYGNARSDVGSFFQNAGRVIAGGQGGLLAGGLAGGTLFGLLRGLGKVDRKLALAISLLGGGYAGMQGYKAASNNETFAGAAGGSFAGGLGGALLGSRLGIPGAIAGGLIGGVGGGIGGGLAGASGVGSTLFGVAAQLLMGSLVGRVARGGLKMLGKGGGNAFGRMLLAGGVGAAGAGAMSQLGMGDFGSNLLWTLLPSLIPGVGGLMGKMGGGMLGGPLIGKAMGKLGQTGIGKAASAAWQWGTAGAKVAGWRGALGAMDWLGKAGGRIGQWWGGQNRPVVGMAKNAMEWVGKAGGNIWKYLTGGGKMGIVANPEAFQATARIGEAFARSGLGRILGTLAGNLGRFLGLFARFLGPVGAIATVAQAGWGLGSMIGGAGTGLGNWIQERAIGAFSQSTFGPLRWLGDKMGFADLTPSATNSVRQTLGAAPTNLGPMLSTKNTSQTLGSPLLANSILPEIGPLAQNSGLSLTARRYFKAMGAQALTQKLGTDWAGSGYNPRFGHLGLDFRMGKTGGTVGDPIKNVIPGSSVLYAGNGAGLNGKMFNGWGGMLGNMVLVRLPSGAMQTFNHLDKIKVKAGQILQPGAVIGTQGGSGNAKVPHLDTMFYRANGTRIDKTSGGINEINALIAANMQLGQQLQGKQLPIEVTINVNGAQDPIAIARQVRAELDKILDQQTR